MERNKRISATLRAIVIMAVLLLVVAFAGKQAYASDKVTVEITGVYGQTEARSMLDMINDLRTGRYVDGGQTKPWARNADGTINTDDYAGLEEIAYDYDLEQAAIQRAIEVAFHFDHTRPNGESCFSVFPDGYSWSGENIAAGNSSAKSTFYQWCETNDDYYGQGHRRNMMDSNFNRVGIAKVTLTSENDSVSFWVQNFGRKTDSAGLTPTTPLNTEVKKKIELDRSYITSHVVETENSSLSVPYGKQITLTGVKVRVQTNETWPYRPVAINGNYTVSTSDSSIGAVTGNVITGKAIGSTTLTVTSGVDASKKATISLKVEPISLSTASVVANPGTFVYSGSAVTPAVSVTHEGKTLTKDVDYTVSYSNNINAGKGTITISGKGIYKDTASGTFDITRRSIKAGEDAITISEIPAQSYTGSKIKPSVEVMYSGKKLVNGKDYTVSYSDNKEPGKATATITGIGNFTDTRTVAFTIKESPLAATEKKLTSQKNDKDAKGSSYGLLQLKSTKQSKKTNTLKWKKVKGAKKYIVYGNKCGKKYQFKKLKTTTKTSFVHKKLKKGTYYKYVVVAVKSTSKGDKTVAVSKVIHVATKGGKVGNHKSVTVKAKVDAKGKKIKKYKALSKTTLKKGKSFSIKATATPASKKLKVKKHRGLAFESSNRKIATVSSKGKVTAKKKGTCYIYVYAQNGVSKRIKVTVK